MKSKRRKIDEIKEYTKSYILSAHLLKLYQEEMGLLSDSLTVLATQLVFFLIGWIFFVKKLFKDYELRHYMVQIIFCINFTLSLTMFELIIFEISDTLERSSRYFHWYLSLYLTLFMVIIMTPLYLRFVHFPYLT